MGSSAKSGKILSEAHRSKKDVLFWVQNIKVPFGIGHPLPTHQISLYVCRRVQGSQIFKQNWIILIRSRFIVILLIWVCAALGGEAGGWGYLGWATIVYLSSGVFRGKESSNRIELSRLVWELLNFGVLGSLWLWGGGRWVGVSGAWKVSPHMYTCMCMHPCTCIHV